MALSALFVEAVSAQQNAQPQLEALPPAATAPSPTAPPVFSAIVNWQKSLVARRARFQRYRPGTPSVLFFHMGGTVSPAK